MQINDFYVNSLDDLKMLRFEEAVVALESGIDLCYANSFPEYSGEYENMYGMFWIKDMAELEIIYTTKGIGIIHQACILPECGIKEARKIMPKSIDNA